MPAAQGLAELLGSSAPPAAAAAAAELATSSTPLLLGRALSTAAAMGTRQLGLPTTAAATPAWRAAPARGFAQMGTKMPRAGYKPPAEMQRAMQMRLSMVSSNLLAEPYRGTPPPLPWSAYLTRAGWAERWRRFMSGVKSLYTLAKCQ